MKIERNQPSGMCASIEFTLVFLLEKAGREVCPDGVRKSKSDY